MTPNDTSEPGHLPAPVAPPPKGLLHLILQHRFFIVSLVVLLFLGVLFARGGRSGSSTPAKPVESSVAAATHDAPAPTVSKEIKLKPLMPAPPKGVQAAIPRSHLRLPGPTSPRWPRHPPRLGRATPRRPRPWRRRPGNRSRARSSPKP